MTGVQTCALPIYQIRSGSSPQLQLVSSLSNGAGGATLNGSTDVCLKGNYAYVSNYFSASLEVLDVSNPAAPVHVSVLANGTGGAKLDTPIGMDLQGDFLYVANHTGSVEVIDISNPVQPKHAASIADGQGGAVLKGLYGGLRVRGNFLYVVGRGAAVLEIIDVSNPYQPSHVEIGRAHV